LINELYLALKMEVYARVNAGFPHKGSLERRAKHIWTSYLDWALAAPERRKVLLQLGVSDQIKAETRARTAEERELVETTIGELATRRSLRGLPAGFAAATMAAMQDATIEFIAKHPGRRKELIDRAFEVFWRAVQ